MKFCLALTAVLLAEGRGVNHNGVPEAHGVQVSHVAVGTGKSHVIVNVAASNHKTAAGTGKIVPPLVDVDTDKKFFGPPFPADYPDDISPPAKKTLFKKDSVYPKVQEEGFFDKDYVKDENSDGGQWQAQSDYDAARTKVYNEKRQAENAKKRAEKEGHDVADARQKVKERQQKEDAASKASAAEEEAKSAAERAREKAENQVADKVAHAHKKASEKAEEEERQEDEAHKALEKKLKEAEEELEQEKESYKNCLKELQEAKAKVEELETQRDKLKNGVHSATKMIAAEPEDSESEKRAVEEAKNHQAAAETKHQEAENKLKVAHDAKEVAQRKLDKEKAENEEAHAAAEKEKEHVKEAEHDLASSRSTLRRIRGLEALPAGEETPAPPKAGAAGMTVSLAVAIVWVTSMTF